MEFYVECVNRPFYYDIVDIDACFYDTFIQYVGQIIHDNGFGSVLLKLDPYDDMYINNDEVREILKGIDFILDNKLWRENIDEWRSWSGEDDVIAQCLSTLVDIRNVCLKAIERNVGLISIGD